MVFSPLHAIASTLAALIILSLALYQNQRQHKALGAAAVLLSLLGLAGYISAGSFRFFPVDLHAFHSWVGSSALGLSLFLFVDKILLRAIEPGKHCRLGRLAALLAAITLITGLWMLSGLIPSQTLALPSSDGIQELTSSPLPEEEALEYRGTKLLPLQSQGNNAITGTQKIEKETYRLDLTGLTVEVNLSYDQIMRLPAYSELVYMPCVEGWGFYAKWTGFRVTDLLNLTGPIPGSDYVIFTSADGYSTSLAVDYLQKNNILLAYGINDVTLPQDRGFPLQLVAKGKYGYKWAKWITRIEVSSNDTRGYWETRGYSNGANVGETPFEL